MLIKVISTQSYDKELYPETKGKPYHITDCSNMSKIEFAIYLDGLKVNKAFGLVDFEILED